MSARRSWFVMSACAALVALIGFVVLRGRGARARPAPVDVGDGVARDQRPRRPPAWRTERPPALASAPPRFAAGSPLRDAMASAEKHRRVLFAAEEAAVARCMRARGFEYQPIPFPDEARAQAARPRVGEPDFARTSGYGLSEAIARGDVRATEDDPNRERVEAMPPDRRRAWEEALRGADRPPPDPKHLESSGLAFIAIPLGPAMAWDPNSCLSTAQRTVYGDDREWKRLTLTMNTLMNVSAADARNDPQVVEALDRWRGCMRERGLSYDAPGAAAGELSAAYHAGKMTMEALRSREIEVASADAECHARAGLGDVVAQAQARAEQRFASQNEELVTEYMAVNEQAVERAGGQVSP